MNVQTTHVMSMPAVLTMKVLFIVNAMLDFLEMDLIVQVRPISSNQASQLLLTF